MTIRGVGHAFIEGVTAREVFDFVLDHLKSRNFLGKAIKMQRERGDEALKKALGSKIVDHSGAISKWNGGIVGERPDACPAEPDIVCGDP